LPSLFLSGLMMPVSLLPGAMRSVAKVFPLTHMLKFINDNSQNSFIYIISAIAICFAIVGYRYKKISIAQ
jgi:ABC-type multidrug transport system permease subunit